MIRGITFDKQLYKSNDYALMIKRFFGDNDGTVYGCNVTSNANNVLISAGYFVASGYYVCLTTQQTIPATTGKLVFEIDLTQVNTEVTFNQGTFKIVTGSLVQEDLFNGGTKYQIYIADVVSNGTSVTSLTVIWGNVFGLSLLKTGGTMTGDLTVNAIVNATTLKQNNKQVSDVYKGTSEPSVAVGIDNDLYIQHEA